MKIVIGLLLALSLSSVQAQKKLEHMEIRTSSVCDMCKKTIESNLIYEKGVKRVDLDLDNSVVHVEYDPKKTGPDSLRAALAKLGYWADDVPADPKAFNDLPACCQKEGCGKKPGTP